MIKSNRVQQGFTLIEVLVTVTIISLLTIIGAVSYQQTAIASRDAKRKADLETVRQALVLFKVDNGTYPVYQGSNQYANFTSALTDLSTGSVTYLSSQQNIVDPKQGTTGFGYRYTSAGPTFNLCATLEKDGSDYCAPSP